MGVWLKNFIREIPKRKEPQKTGLSRSSIAGIENGRNFSISSLISISRSLELLDQFEFFLKEEEYKLTPMEIYEMQKKRKKRGGYNK